MSRIILDSRALPAAAFVSITAPFLITARGNLVWSHECEQDQTTPMGGFFTQATLVLVTLYEWGKSFTRQMQLVQEHPVFYAQIQTGAAMQGEQLASRN